MEPPPPFALAADASPAERFALMLHERVVELEALLDDARARLGAAEAGLARAERLIFPAGAMVLSAPTARAGWSREAWVRLAELVRARWPQRRVTAFTAQGLAFVRVRGAHDGATVLFSPAHSARAVEEAARAAGLDPAAVDLSFGDLFASLEGTEPLLL